MGDRQHLSRIAVDNCAKKMLALYVPFYEVGQIPVVDVTWGSLKALLQIFRKYNGPMGEVVLQITAFRSHLVEAIEQGHTENAYSQRNDNFERRENKH